MNQETLTQPLYKVLNANRTQGELIVDYGATKGHIKAVTGKEKAATPTVLKYDIFKEFEGSLYKPEEQKANGDYAALAVNNLTALAEALEEAIKEMEMISNKYPERVLMRINQAKAALSKIS